MYTNAAHGERIYVTVGQQHKAAFRALGGRYGHGMAPFHDLAHQSSFQTCAAHETDPDPEQHDCCLYHDRDCMLFYTLDEAQKLKALDRSLFWKAWYWSNAPVRDDLETEVHVRLHLADVHEHSAFARYDLDAATFLSLRQQALDTAAAFSYENPNPGLHEAKVRARINSDSCEMI
jgi:hypothetical protein